MIETESYWHALLAWRQKGCAADQTPDPGGAGPCRQLHELFAELLALPRTRTHIIAHLGQSLDGRIATACGHSHYVNGEESLKHLHRLRASSDAVLIGVETAIADKPRLTTRHCAGPSPIRVIIDPRGRLPGDHNLRTDQLAETLVLTRKARWSTDIEIAGSAPRFTSREIIDVLASLGLTRLMVEGGGRTVSAFLQDRALDRLQLAVAPIIIGSGRDSIKLAEIQSLDDAIRPAYHVYRLGSDTLFDLKFNATQF